MDLAPVPQRTKAMPDPTTPSEKKQDEDLDEALEETFPASDPISPMEPEERRAPPAKD